MAINECRVCEKPFFFTPLLHYKDMPSSAQYLPDVDSLDKDYGVDLIVCQCTGCGLVQLSNEPVSYYKEVIRAAGISKEMTEFRKEQFGNFTKKYSLRNKKVVEIGCGKGEYLALMKQTGVDAYGIEASYDSVNYCKSNGFNVSQEYLENAGQIMANAPFDAFFMLNFLEHFPDPNSALMGINNNLAPMAVGIIEVPFFDLGRKTLFSEFIRDHLFYFTEDTLNMTLEQNGFEVLESNKVWHDSSISVIVRKRNKLDLSHFQDYQEWLKLEMEQHIEKFESRKVAIWGASHQSLAIIAMFNLANKIKFVIDSAPFKQGRFTPATHIRIVKPDVLDSDPVDAIIVMAAHYSNEVASFIRKKYGTNMDIAILRDSGLEIFS